MLSETVSSVPQEEFITRTLASDSAKMRIHYMRDLKTVRPKLPSKNTKNRTFTRGEPVGCIVTLVDKEKNIVYFQYAISHPKDTFIKRRAIQIAKARLEKQPWKIDGIPDSKHEIYAKIVSYIVKNTAFLANARKATREQMEQASSWRISARFHMHARAWMEQYNKLQKLKQSVLEHVAKQQNTSAVI
jgi:hypothetical protein